MSGGRSRDVGSGRGSRPERHNVNLSKALSWLLRHNMLNQGLIPTPEGYVDLSAVLSLPRFKGYTAADVEEVVELNDKKRFSIRVHPDTGNKQIRANQGHSIQHIDPGLTPITDPSHYPVIVHGTYLHAWDKIKARGLNRMKRNHIHFATGLFGEENVLSGMRADCEVFIYIDLKKALDADYKFFLSENQVILCPGDATGFLPIEFFEKVLTKNKVSGQMEPLI